MDNVVNDFGRKLVQFCQAHQLFILNGRAAGDIPARFTSHANAGSSVIDCFIASTGVCKRAYHLEVGDIVPASDHFPVILTLDSPTVSS